MKYIKYFENNNLEQSPFFLSKSDYLYLSYDFAKKIAPNYENNTKYRINFINNQLEYQKIFFDKSSEPIRRLNKIFLNMNVSYNIGYVMNLELSKRVVDTKFGSYYCFLYGYSGDHEMHGKNMVRATRECNLNFIIKYYPIVKHIKNFYSIFKTGEYDFFELIKKSIIKDNKLINHGVPSELEKDKDISMLISMNKYNL